MSADAEALAAALRALQRTDSTPTVVVVPPAPQESARRPPAQQGQQYFTTPTMPMKWRLNELSVDEDNVPLNLGTERVPEEEEAHWSSMGFKLPRRGANVRMHYARTHDRTPPRRNGLEVDWDCGICLEPASDPCVTRCGHLFCERDLRMWFKTKPAELQCPACNAACNPEHDVVPIHGRAKNQPNVPLVPRAELHVVGSRLRPRRFASRTPSVQAIPAGGTESDTSIDPPSLTTSSAPSSHGSPTPSGTVTPAAYPEPDAQDNIFSLLVPQAHPLVRQAIISRELGRLLSLVGFVALMIFLLK